MHTLLPSPRSSPTLVTRRASSAKIAPRLNLGSGFHMVPTGKFRRVSVALPKNVRFPVRIMCEVEGLDSGKKDDAFYMRRCVQLARRAVGCTSPNPMVGCVIVKDGVVVGEGFHPKAGQPHAEVFALRDAGNLAESATAYVSLEPCNHYGRTPPCTEALIRANVKRVVVGMVDPNPIVASKGVERLREAGINVTVSMEEMLCRRLNEAYIHKMLTGKPFVTLRYSLSVNGGTLDELGEMANDSGGYYSQLLQENDVLVISNNSSLIRNIRLPTLQETGAKKPLVIMIPNSDGPTFQLPGFSKGAGVSVTVFLDKDTTISPQTESDIKKQGIEVVVSDKIKLSSILDYYSSMGMCSVMLDLSRDDTDFDKFLEECLEDGLVQKVVMEVCPTWDKTNESSVLNVGRKRLSIKNMQSKIVRESILIEGYVS